MNAKVHMHLSVRNLETSKAFYAKFLGAPVKDLVGYAKFLPEFAPLNLALSQGRRDAPPERLHTGIQVETPAEVMAHLARVTAAGLAVREELGVDCCHANQDKFWVTDPDGLEWEVYHLNYDLEPKAKRFTGFALPMVAAMGVCS